MSDGIKNFITGYPQVTMENQLFQVLVPGETKTKTDYRYSIVDGD